MVKTNQTKTKPSLKCLISNFETDKRTLQQSASTNVMDRLRGQEPGVCQAPPGCPLHTVLTDNGRNQLVDARETALDVTGRRVPHSPQLMPVVTHSPMQDTSVQLTQRVCVQALRAPGPDGSPGTHGRPDGPVCVQFNSKH